MGKHGRGHWRILAQSTEELARCLEVSPPAIRKAEASGRITQELDGTWDVLGVVHAWRDSVNLCQQRDPPSWLDPRVELDVTRLIRRSRYAGARIEFQEEGDKDWREVPDPVLQVNVGHEFDTKNDVADWLGLSELNGIIPLAGFWLDVPEMARGIVAHLCDVTLEKARDALAGAIGWSLLVNIAATEEEWLGPATASAIRNGRIPLSDLTTPDAPGVAS